ncbi:hypothetical protein BU14_0368s0012 [Porphyra umbilicalis]|uniref:Uncharacterized protein n=1 Tax=Porphyra umbilicalis TaxID=2786 RepID=A0A1X6NXB1_PORUM|nr:hypothetical protein BU14_0368s0012 [Porphyra umbilicalis]|eukprot:OSX73212.1 hypothetical protein BU14_0368s0012 [Porphyra umbilicalis]
MPAVHEVGACAPALTLPLASPLVRPLVAGVAGGLAAALPAGLARRLTATYNADAGAVAASIRTGGGAGRLAANVLGLVWDEAAVIRAVRGDATTAALAAGGRLRVLAVEGDRWCGPPAVERLRAAWGVDVTMVPRVEHAFVVAAGAEDPAVGGGSCASWGGGSRLRLGGGGGGAQPLLGRRALRGGRGGGGGARAMAVWRRYDGWRSPTGCSLR